MLLTRSRLCPGPKTGSSLHLHVLSTPPAFVLSQDQTLREDLAKPQAPLPKELTRPRNLAKEVDLAPPTSEPLKEDPGAGEPF